MKFGIDKGHNVNYDTGARGIRIEDELTKEVGNKVIDKLRQLGHTAIDCTPLAAHDLNESLYLRAVVANREGVDAFVSIHFNAGGGTGSEVYAISSKGQELASKVLKEIVALGYPNRGVKSDNFYVLTHTNAPAILIECSFVDSQEDMNRYNAEAIATAIVKGLTGQIVATLAYPGYLIMFRPNRFDDNVKLIQAKLNIDADGYFGMQTSRAVKSFQSSHGLDADGIVGPMTWNKIFN